MNVSSRTPEGLPNQCPVCGKEVRLEPSEPAGDATCPHCGSLLWFVVTDVGAMLFEKIGLTGIAGAERPKPTAGNISRTEVPGSGMRMRITQGTFAGFEGELVAVDRASGVGHLMINIFGRATPLAVPLEQLEPADR